MKNLAILNLLLLFASFRCVIGWNSHHPNYPTTTPRRGFFRALVLTSSMSLAPLIANADISDGNELPKGAAQFNRIVRLKKDLKKVRQRVEEASSEIEKDEWENIGQFLRMAYGTGNDMKDLAAGIKSEENRKKAQDDIEKLQKYAQAADVTVVKKDGSAFVDIAGKMSALVDDYFNCLYDVPDEL